MYFTPKKGVNILKVTKLISKIWVVLFGLALGIAIPTMTMSVLAGGATSATGYYSTYGYSYSNYSKIYVSDPSEGSRYSNSTTRAQTTSSTVPGGYMGARSRTYNSSDALVASTEFIYNTGETSFLNSNFASYTPIQGKSYYSKGATAAYSSGGYVVYTTFASPLQTSY